MADRLTLTERLDWLQLARSSGVGPKTFYLLLHRFGGARQAYEALPRLAQEAEGRERPRCRREDAEAELDALHAMGCHLIAHGEVGYPALLSEIHDPPPLLTVRGSIEAIHAQTVAIVGARNASANGRLLAGRMAKSLAEAGHAVVSGLARGIDTAVHEGALVGKGCTVAVIASGVDIAYPPENAAMMASIAEKGAIVSERPLGSAPQARQCSRRNRLISGLSRGVVVIEAAPRSGSLITARMAIEQGREVMAVPGSPLDARHRGTNQLIREGAALIETAEDIRKILASLALMKPRLTIGLSHSAVVDQPTNPSNLLDEPDEDDTFEDRQDRLGEAGNVTVANPSASGSPIADELLHKRVFERLGTEPLLVDELIRQCHANSSEMQHALIELELEGRIERHAGNRVSLATS